jgi:hypothetical protein
LRLNILAKQVLDLAEKVRTKIMTLTGHKPRDINIDVFSNPEKYLVCLPMDKIVADTKVSPEFVARYINRIQSGEKVGPIIVVKHPKFDLYAVLDGHHRYYALLELGRKEVTCALAGDFSKIFFFMTEHGYFQPQPPQPEENKDTIKPDLHFHENLQDFLHNFLKDPNKVRNPAKEKPN